MTSLVPLLPLSLLLLTVATPCQRQEASLDWQTRNSTLAYGAVPLAQHSLTELPVGQTWRLGMNEASTWTTELPVVAGERALPPGAYRIHLHRTAESSCAIVAEGSGLPGGGEDFRVEGAIEKVDKPGKKLAIEWQKGASKDKVTLPADLSVLFGENKWRSNVALVGAGKPVNCGGFMLTVFSLPAEVVAARAKTPIPAALLTQGKGKSLKCWNLMIGGDKAQLVPWMVAPVTLQDKVTPPAADNTWQAEVSASARDGAEPPMLQLDEVKADKQKAALTLGAGKETLKVEFYLPGMK